MPVLDNKIIPNNSVLLTGGNGVLATEIKKILDCRAIDKKDLDITEQTAVADYFRKNQYSTLIHCAAYTDVAEAENEKQQCYDINVQGTENLVKNFKGDKFVYLSTDYVFDGKKGNYKESDAPNPVNYYALTKLLGEVAVRQYPKTLIIRTTFKPNGQWPYPKAFTDLWTSADYVSQIAPQIVAAALMTNLLGIVHIAGSRKTIYQLARQQTPAVGKMSINDVATKLPPDVSLDCSKWHSINNS